MIPLLCDIQSQSEPISLNSILILGGIIGGIIAFANVAIHLGDRLWGKPKETANIKATQSDACKFDHQNVHTSLRQQSTEIQRLTEGILKTVESMQNSNHAAELRHQVTLARLEHIATLVETRRHD